MLGFGRAALAAAVTIVLGFGVSAAGANQPPPLGSYLKTCSNARMVDKALVATCLMADQTPRETSLENPFACRGSITNVNGELTCEPDRAPPASTPSVPVALAKFEHDCDSDAWYVVRRAGLPGGDLRFHLERHQKAHFELPEGSTYAMRCDGWPGANDAFRVVKFE